MQTLRRHSQPGPPPLARRLPAAQPPSFSRSISRNNIQKPFLFARNPDDGPAAPPRHYSTANPDTPPVKRSEQAQDDSLYLHKTDDANFYGRFITLGYHDTSGPVNDPLRTRKERNKTFELWKHVKPNGWKFIRDARSGLQATTVISSATREKMRAMSLNTPFDKRSMTSIRVAGLEKPDQVIEYTLIPSSDHDLFQFGRDPYNNDFHIPGHTIEGHTWDPVSRLAFRVQCSRIDPQDIRIAAAGFDYANELFLGPYALRWRTQSEGGPPGGMDGGITVGLYLWKPKENQDGTKDGEWYEVSALGEVYHLRVGRSRGRKAVGVDNTLTDGCIIVNANSVLLFTTTPPSKDSEYLTPETLSTRLEQITTTLCPITLDTINFRNAMASQISCPLLSSPPIFDLSPDPDADPDTYSTLRRAGVFPQCGHVYELPLPHINANLISCPKCRVVGRMIPLIVQTGPTLISLDAEFTHVIPCGHAVSQELGEKMASVPLPTNDLLLGDTEAKAWGDALLGRRRRCWLCGGGFYPSDLKRLFFETKD